MKLHVALTAIAFAIAPFVVVPIVSPYWEGYQRFVSDCVDTKPANRTPKQAQNCKDDGTIGFIIPGIL